MYNCLTEEEEGSAINNFLQDLMEQEVLDSAVMEQLAMDAGQTRKKFRNPAIMMNARHQQVPLYLTERLKDHTIKKN